MEVRIEHLRPGQIEDAQKKRPVLFMPLGTVEWHGRQNVVGLDTLKAYELCIQAAKKAGGLVMPPLYGGMGGLEEPFTFIVEPEHSFYSLILRPWLERQCSEAIRHGFKAVIMLTGHYGASQQIIVRETAVRMSRVLNCPVLGTPEYFLALDEKYTGDHAAFFETSLMMHLYPESVDLDQLGDPPHQGVHGRDPKAYANAKDGKRIADAIVARLVSLAEQMPDWNADTRAGFIRAEQALVSKQLTLGGQSGNIWTAWRNIGNGAFAQYPEYLTSARFDDIVKLVEDL